MNARRRPSVAATVVLAVSTLSLYLGLVYVFAFTQAAGSARLAIHCAILMMDVLIAAILFRDRAALFPSSEASPRATRELQWIFWILAYGSLVCVALLHADYGLARHRGAEEGLTGSLLTLKTRVLALQLSYVFFVTLSKTLPDLAPLGAALFKTDAADVLLFSVVVIPLVNYLAHNSALFSFLSAVQYLAIFLVCPIVALMFVRLLERALNAHRIGAPLVAGLAFVYYSMPLVSAMARRPIEALFWAELGLAVAIPAAIATMYHVNSRSTARALAVIAALSAAGSILQGAGARADSRDVASRAAIAVPDASRTPLADFMSAPAKRTPDVYLLIYDAYAPSAMMRRYGVDDSAGARLLAQKGFTLYDKAYSLLMSSQASMAAVMDMRTTARAGIAGPTTASTFFKSHGYRTYLVLNSYLMQGGVPQADSVFPPWSPQSGLSMLYRGIDGGEFKSQIVFQDSDRAEWLAAKRSVLSAQSGPPRMLYAHSGFPGHSQNSGACLADESARYAARLSAATAEMKEDIDAIEHSGRQAIVIVAGDHGPYLTGDCLYMSQSRPDQLTAVHFGDRYGVKLAIRWPHAVPGQTDRVEVLQDVLLAVAAYVLDDGRVWHQRPMQVTTGYGGIPDGAIKDGIVAVGADRGRPLFP